MGAPLSLEKTIDYGSSNRAAARVYSRLPQLSPKWVLFAADVVTGAGKMPEPCLGQPATKLFGLIVHSGRSENRYSSFGFSTPE